mmetsp:Transcript_22525/g.68663  ORF Transcript_22525/g.68663 Transcript_22525/m.68663 type:complete len:106 (+) Transcript_22525:250-567(+)|eukprot:scaffold260435_cov32-Tisochrysis_lutea.AAC.2
MHTAFLKSTLSLLHPNKEQRDALKDGHQAGEHERSPFESDSELKTVLSEIPGNGSTEGERSSLHASSQCEASAPKEGALNWSVRSVAPGAYRSVAPVNERNRREP